MEERSEEPPKKCRKLEFLFSVGSITSFLKHSTLLRECAELATVFIIHFQLLYARMHYQFSPLVTLAPLLAYSLYLTLRNCCLYTSSATPATQAELISSALNWCTVTLYLFAIMGKTLWGEMECIYINTPFCLALAAKLVFPRSFWHELSSADQIFCNVARYAFVIQSIICSLKLDQRIHWDWNTVFWPYFLSVSVMALWTLTWAVLSCRHVVLWMKGVTDATEVVVALWLCTALIGVTVCSLVLVMSIIEYWREDDSEALEQTLIVQFLILSVIAIYSLLLYFKLKQNGSRTNQIQRPDCRQTSSNLEEFAGCLSSLTVTKLPPNAPKWLYRYSSTYFQRVAEHVPTPLTSRETLRPLDEEQESGTGSGSGSGSGDKGETPRVEEMMRECVSGEAAHTEEVKETESVEHVIMSHRRLIGSNSGLKLGEVSCVLCIDGASDAVLMECGHSGICFKCAIKLLYQKASCPMCRRKVSMILRIEAGQSGEFAQVLCGMSPDSLQEHARTALTRRCPLRS